MSTDTHSAGCKCWQCQGDPFAGIPQADDKPLAADLGTAMSAEILPAGKVVRP